MIKNVDNRLDDFHHKPKELVQMPISLSSLGPGPNPPKIIDVLIEIPKDSRIKYEADFKSGMLRVDRVLSVAALYPCNYGFIPGTLEVDSEDPIDVYVLGQIC